MNRDEGLGRWLITLAAPGMGSTGPWITNTVYAILVSLTLRYRWVRGHWRQINVFADNMGSLAERG
jgi:hypothetical protein